MLIAYIVAVTISLIVGMGFGFFIVANFQDELSGLMNKVKF